METLEARPQDEAQAQPQEAPATPGPVESALAAYAAQAKRAADCDAALAGWQRAAQEAFSAGRWAAAGALWARCREVAVHRPELSDTPGRYVEARRYLVEGLWARVRHLETQNPTLEHLPHVAVRAQLMRWLGASGLYNADHWPPRVTGDESTAERAVMDMVDRTAKLRNAIPEPVNNQNALPEFVRSIEALHTICAKIEADLPRAWRCVAKARTVRQPSGVGDNFSSAAGWQWVGDELEGCWARAGFEVPTFDGQGPWDA